jgi:hypothetical protein
LVAEPGPFDTGYYAPPEGSATSLRLSFLCRSGLCQGL